MSEEKQLSEAQLRLKEIEEEIDKLEKEADTIYRKSLLAPENEKVVEDWIAKLHTEDPLPRFPVPVEVYGLTSRGRVLYERTCKTGDLVKIRPCAPEHKNKTFLGVYIGDIATGVGATLNPKDGVLGVHPAEHNPAILVPELGKLVFGYESWWGPIKSEEELKQITNDDIANVWYVKLWKQMFEEKKDADTSG